MNKKGWVIFFVLAISVFAGCRSRKLLKIDEPQKVKIKINKRIKAESAEFNYLSAKSKIEFTDGLDNFTSHATFRIRKDSVIWVSVNPALGIEVVRCLINRDSVLIINKFQKQYFAFSFKELSEKLNFEINYDLIQSILFGNLPFAETDDDSSFSDSTHTVIGQTRKNIYIQNFIRNQTRKLEKLAVKDEINGNSLDINYENFFKVEDILFAFTNKISLNYRNKKGFQNIYIGIEHNKLEPSNKDLKFPFNIPSRYEKKE